MKTTNSLPASRSTTGHPAANYPNLTGSTAQHEKLTVWQLSADLEKQVDRHLSLAVSIFQNLDEESLMRPSASGGWSIAECLWHLNSYGQYYLPLIKNALDEAPTVDGSTTFRSGFMGGYVIRMMEQQNKKYKAASQHMPGHIGNPHSVVSEFIQQQEDLLQLLRMAGRKDLGKNRIPVSVMKWVKLKTGDIFQFIVAHNERHIQQAKRNVQ